MKLKSQEESTNPCLPTMGQPADYRIEILGHLDSSWSDRLSGMRMTTTGGKDVVARTVLEGQIMDQSALSGVLSTLCDLGYPLISVLHNPVNAHRENEIV